MSSARESGVTQAVLGVAAWRERVGAAFMDFYMEAPRRRPFPARLALSEFGALRLYDFSAPAHHVRRPPDAASAGAREALLAVLQVAGECHYQDVDASLALLPGDLMFLPAGRRFEMAFPTAMQLRVVAIPPALLAHAPLAGHCKSATVARAGSGTGAIGRALLDSAFANSARLAMSARARLARTLVDVLDTVAGDAMTTAGTPARGARERQLSRILTYLHEHLAEPGLDARTVAQALRISPRHLRDLLHAQGTSFGKLRLAQRLDRCREELLDPHHHHRSVSEIAYAWGFNSPAHFSRVFRARYGVAPVRCRISGPAE